MNPDHSTTDIEVIGDELENREPVNKALAIKHWLDQCFEGHPAHERMGWAVLAMFKEHDVDLNASQQTKLVRTFSNLHKMLEPYARQNQDSSERSDMDSNTGRSDFIPG